MNKLYINNILFEGVLAAISPEEQAYGLMYKSWPPPIMVFPYKKSERRNFWMKNTISPLDIIFCKENEIIEIANGKPLSMANISSKKPTDLVIEMPHGTVEKYNIKIGDKIRLKYSIETLSKMFLETLSKIG